MEHVIGLREASHILLVAQVSMAIDQQCADWFGSGLAGRAAAATTSGQFFCESPGGNGSRRYNTCMSTTAQFMTADQLLHMPSNGFRYELVEGELHKMTPAGSEHGFFAAEIGGLLHDFVRRNKLGCVFGAETGFRIGRNPDTVLAPDASFVRKERIQVIGIPKAYFPEAPALVVEVVSPSDTVEEVDEKMRRWLAAGAELVWVIHPGGRMVTVYRSLTDVRVLTADDVLDGGDLVPGFRCRVGDLFAAIDG